MVGTFLPDTFTAFCPWRFQPLEFSGSFLAVRFREGNVNMWILLRQLEFQCFYGTNGGGWYYLDETRGLRGQRLLVVVCQVVRLFRGTPPKIWSLRKKNEYISFHILSNLALLSIHLSYPGCILIQRQKSPKKGKKLCDLALQLLDETCFGKRIVWQMQNMEEK